MNSGLIDLKSGWLNRITIKERKVQNIMNILPTLIQKNTQWPKQWAIHFNTFSAKVSTFHVNCQNAVIVSEFVMNRLLC